MKGEFIITDSTFDYLRIVGDKLPILVDSIIGKLLNNDNHKTTWFAKKRKEFVSSTAFHFETDFGYVITDENKIKYLQSYERNGWILNYKYDEVNNVMTIIEKPLNS